MILLHPHRLAVGDDARLREILEKTVAFFEAKGKRRLKEDDKAHVWYDDFLGFVRDERVFATLLTPPEYGTGDTRWDTRRICHFNEVVSFYGLCYWYTWQVSILGLGPVWMSPNEELKRRAGRMLEEGGIFAFGLSERAHGADIYSTEMRLDPVGPGRWVANGGKYYIGNGNEAALVSVFGKRGDTGDYVFFAADPRHERFHLVRNVVPSQSYVAEFELRDYPVTDADILLQGPAAWDASLNTVNIGKYNLGWASIGICTHALYEALDHAAHRVLYGMKVTDFPHVQRLFTDAYLRLVAMKLFGLRSADYMRSASADDRRYLLYNPVMKMKVTTQGEEVINLMWDVIAAKGFETDTYFEMAARDIRALPKLEGTVHVNIALIVKFMQNYFFNPADYPEVPVRDDPAHDAFLFDQGPARGLGKIRFHDYRGAFRAWDLPNVRVFLEQVDELLKLLVEHTPNEAQRKNTDFLLCLGELFTLVVYAQLICEAATLHGVDADHVDAMFHAFVRDFSRLAVDLLSRPSTTEGQAACCRAMIRRPVTDPALLGRLWKDAILPLSEAYRMPE
ncbi:acyl-CoA dehydrogenase [Deferrisoma sp.]